MALFAKPKEIKEDINKKLWELYDQLYTITSNKTKKINLLIVEDNTLVGKGLTEAFKAFHNVYWVKSKQELLSTLETLPEIDIVLLDIFLTDGRGNDILPNIKKKYPDCEVIITTTLEISEIAVDVLKKGAYQYISKVFSLSDLMQQIFSAMQLKTLKEILRELDISILQKFIPLESRKLFAETVISSTKNWKIHNVLNFVPELKPHILKLKSPVNEIKKMSSKNELFSFL